MATTTTRLGLTKPDFVDVVDISELNSNADDIDAAVGAAVVTSSTRPGAPWLGQIIHETDTDKTLVWDGVAWVETGTAVEDLDDLGDVTITTPADGEVLTYDSGDWVNQALTSAQLPTGSILQVVQTVKTDTFSTSSSTYTAVTGVSATLTPSSSANKVLVTVTGVVGNNNSTFSARLRLLRGATAIALSTGSPTQDTTQSVFTDNAGASVPFSFHFLDSPGVTSATAYSLHIATGGGAAFIGRFPGSDTFRSITSITVMEVAG
jgi:hypothetical protein